MVYFVTCLKPFLSYHSCLFVLLISGNRNMKLVKINTSADKGSCSDVRKIQFQFIKMKLLCPLSLVWYFKELILFHKWWDFTYLSPFETHHWSKSLVCYVAKGHSHIDHFRHLISSELLSYFLHSVLVNFIRFSYPHDKFGSFVLYISNITGFSASCCTNYFSYPHSK